jgi:rod shape-determining protein MreB and related proteins
MLKKLFNIRLSSDVGIDLGTANCLVYVEGKGIIMSEPSVVAINKKTGQILAIGEEARKMVGRTPSHIVATRPLVSGVVSDFDVTEQMLRYFIERANKSRFPFSTRPRVVIGIPCGVTEVEKKAVEDAGKNAGAKRVFLIEEPMAAAIGIRLPIQDPGGNFVVDIGGGTTEVAVISLGGVVISRSLRVAGDKLNEDIINFVESEYNLLIGERTAEDVKTKIGSATPLEEKMEYAVRGRNLVNGLPEEIIITDSDVRKALAKSVREIVETVKETVEETPPELIADIMSRGIYLLGGGSLLKGLDLLIEKETKIKTQVGDDPLTAVVRGAGYALEHLDKHSEIFIETEELKTPKQR